MTNASVAQPDEAQDFALFPWDKSFNTGIEEIDRQHRHLVNILNQLVSRLIDHSDTVSLKECFSALIDYANYHFTTEEKYLAKYLPDNPYTAAHQQVHDQFREAISQLQDSFTKDKEERTLQEVVSFLFNWLIFHILEDDMQLADLVRQAQIAQNGTTELKESDTKANKKRLLQALMRVNQRLSNITLDAMREKTLQKRAEQVLRTQNTLLEQSIVERTHDLFFAKEEADVASKAKTEFLNKLSHELRTPINIIMGMTNLAMDSAVDDEQRDYLRYSLNAANQLLHIINDTLDFSNAVNNRLSLNQSWFLISDLFDEVAGFLSDDIQQKQLELKTHIDQKLSKPIICDKERLYQILLSLLSNAIKFNTMGGSVAIEATLDESKSDLKISITDTGIGIASDLNDKLFKVFFQADNSSTRQYSGLGIGLALSKKLVELMNGQIWFNSEEGNGAVFHLSIPLISHLAPPSR